MKYSEGSIHGMSNMTGNSRPKSALNQYRSYMALFSYIVVRISSASDLESPNVSLKL